MEKQHIFKNKYVQTLKETVENGGDISGYQADIFPYDETQLLVLPNRTKPEKLLDKMLAAESDFDAAIALFTAYRDLEPIEASYAPLWDYLAHVDLYPFVKKRWPKAFEPETNSRQYILDHWFVSGRGLMRHSLSNLWWTVSMTIDGEDISLTEFIFDKREDLRLALGISTLYRYRPFTRGLLRFLKDNPEVTAENTLARERYIIQYFNRLGSVKQLAFLDEHYFIKTLNEMKTKIMSVSSRDDLF